MSKENIIYIILYGIFLSFFTLMFIKYNNPSNIKFLIFIFVLIFIIGLISIYHYTKNKNKIYKTAFIVIILFGLCSVILTPINDVSDEYEHLVRSEIVSRGEITTNYINPIGFKSIDAINNLGIESDTNLFNTNLWNLKINYSDYYSDCAFAQNPFYAYLAPAFGIIIAKFLDLNTIWLLYLGRICNLLLYASITTIAIKKSPIFKTPLFIISIFPLAIYQAGSVSSDCFFNAFAILAIAYFFILYKSHSIKYKDLSFFYISIILCGLLKQPYLALSLLIFIVPSSNFKNKKQEIISKIAILAVLTIGVLWSSYATTQMKYSWRANHFIQYHVNASQQANFMLSDPKFDIYYIFEVIRQIPVIFTRLFEFSVSKFSYNSILMSTLYFIYIIAVSLFYPLKEKLSKINRLKTAIISAIIFYGIFLVQYLTWIPVKSANVILGVSGRYFIPLLIFIPLILNLNSKIKLDKTKVSSIVFTIAISFIAGMLMLTTSVKF